MAPSFYCPETALPSSMNFFPNPGDVCLVDDRVLRKYCVFIGFCFTSNKIDKQWYAGHRKGGCVMVFAHLRGMKNLSEWENVAKRDEEMITFLRKEQGIEVKMLTSDAMVKVLDAWPGTLSHFECVFYAVKIYRWLTGTLEPSNTFGQIELVGQLLKWGHTSDRQVKVVPVQDQQSGPADDDVVPIENATSTGKREPEEEGKKGKRRRETEKNQMEKTKPKRAKMEQEEEEKRKERNKKRREQRRRQAEAALKSETVEHDVVHVTVDEKPPLEVVSSDDVRKVVIQQVLAQTQWLVSDVS